MAYDRELAARIRDHLAGQEGITEKAMFGGLAFLVHGNMAVAAMGAGGVMVRVAPDGTAALVADRGARRMVMRGREMDGWLDLDRALVDEPGELARWTDLGVTFARGLPPKG